MDAQKVAFLLGETANGEDPDDREVRHLLVEQRMRREQPALDDGSPASAFAVLVHQQVADQIAEDNPPEVWETARRLLGSGLEAKFVMSNLVLALNATLVASLDDDEPVDDGHVIGDHYIEELDRLPLPPVREMFEAFKTITRERRSVSAEELIATTVTTFSGPGEGQGDVGGRNTVDRNTAHWVELALDHLVDMEPSMIMLPPDLIVHLPTLLSGATLTHRLTESECSRRWLATGADLAPLLCWSEPLLLADGSEVEIDAVTSHEGILEGAPGWLEGFEPGTTIGFRIEGNTVSLAPVGDPGPPDPEVVEAARAAYDREVAEPWLPVWAEEIVAGMLLDHPGILSAPTVPLSELLARAGLEQRGVEFAHEESVWRRAHSLDRIHRLYDRLSDHDDRLRAGRVIGLLDAEERSSETMREALSTLRDPRLLSVLTDELLDFDDDDEQCDEVAEFAEALLASARRPADGAPARWLLAVVSERRGDPLAGQAQLDLAVRADPDFAPAIDRLAWYLSDRGDAVGAARLWRRLGLDEDDSVDLREIAAFAQSGPSSTGRNEPCWCGSGRKFKHCHLGEPPTFPLPQRVGWLCWKAVAYLERRGGETYGDVYQHAVMRADGDDSHAALDRAFSDPLVMDVVLHEGGWFDRFLAERGALLPDDEAMLAAAWTLIDRTLYEVVESRPGEGMVVRDLRTADLVEVRERTFSRQARTGQVFCGRAVPDGETHQFIGGIVEVATGQEKDLLDLLDEGDGEELLAWVAARERPPRLVTREGEDLLACTVVVEVPDPDAARVVLDRVYDADGRHVWREHDELPNGESILRASITLEGGRITVETMSEPRVERVLGVLTGTIAGAEVISDERHEIDPTKPPPGPTSPPLSKDDPAVKEMLRTFFAEREQAWCDEEIPALGGLTPRQAAADPAGREALERLLVEYGSYVDPEEDPELASQHPDRLRRLLGLGSPGPWN
jgi:hypothetical protein